MPKINLIKRSTVTIDEFRSWLHQLIQDKKGALPDLDDWKLIKEHLDKVGKRVVQDDTTGYSICQGEDDYPEFEPYDMQFTLDLLDRLCIDTDIKYDTNYKDGLINEFYDEYVRDIKTTEWEVDEMLACTIRETHKEYENGETKTEYSRETTTSSST